MMRSARNGGSSGAPPRQPNLSPGRQSTQRTRGCTHATAWNPESRSGPTCLGTSRSARITQPQRPGRERSPAAGDRPRQSAVCTKPDTRGVTTVDVSDECLDEDTFGLHRLQHSGQWRCPWRQQERTTFGESAAGALATRLSIERPSPAPPVQPHALGPKPQQQAPTGAPASVNVGSNAYTSITRACCHRTLGLRHGIQTTLTVDLEFGPSDIPAN